MYLEPDLYPLIIGLQLSNTVLYRADTVIWIAFVSFSIVNETQVKTFANERAVINKTCT